MPSLTIPLSLLSAVILLLAPQVELKDPLAVTISRMKRHQRNIEDVIDNPDVARSKELAWGKVQSSRHAKLSFVVDIKDLMATMASFRSSPHRFPRQAAPAVRDVAVHEEETPGRHLAGQGGEGVDDKAGMRVTPIRPFLRVQVYDR